jgi:DDE_Tnp_1-associated
VSRALARFAEVSDGRRDQTGLTRSRWCSSLCAAVVVAGMGSFTAIAGWAADVPAELLAQLYGRVAAPPSKATIWRVITGADAAAMDAVIGAWLAGQATTRETATPGSEGDSPELVAIAVGGKTVRGATATEGNQGEVAGLDRHRFVTRFRSRAAGARSAVLRCHGERLGDLDGLRRSHDRARFGRGVGTAARPGRRWAAPTPCSPRRGAWRDIGPGCRRLRRAGGASP